ncbi:helix-turn-helix transcriptional regulator [Gluconacetobacter diazotrophicus]|uniref:helix-turn-helix transcriptional regulator n=1 Tax=Gluconacetobacter diazotrophicus TaxID=33996 RepID=UPI00059DDEAF|nr:helix-turn-helix domain-containing protein [Gluconacetobacter diazotrophicus]
MQNTAVTNLHDDARADLREVVQHHNEIFASPKEIQRRFGMGNTMFYRLMNEGKFEAVKFGSATRVRIASVEAYFDSLPRVSKSRA